MKLLLAIMQNIKRKYRLRRWLTLGALCFVAVLIWLASVFEVSNGEQQLERHDLIVADRSDHAQVVLVTSNIKNDGHGEVTDNSYIGLDEHDVLSLFDGPPSDDNVIRSFFQINVKYLESSLPPEIVEQLYNGIRVTSLTEYNSVLSTFSDYAISISEEVMQHMQ